MSAKAIAKRTIVAHAGDPFEVVLDGAGPAGFEWVIDDPSPDLEVMRRLVRPNLRRFGAGGQEVYVLRARTSGPRKVAFKLVRPWNGEVARRHEVDVSIEP